MKARLTVLLLCAGIPGCIAVSWWALPMLADPSALEVSMTSLRVATAVQSVLLVAIAAALGAWLSPSVGLTAPAAMAAVSGQGVRAAMKSQVAPGAVGGLIGAAIVLGFHAFVPEQAAVLGTRAPIPLVPRLLYGGVTEEILVRWGLMTLLVWLGWKLLQRGTGPVSGPVVWLGILASAWLFGMSHVPAAGAVIGEMSLYVAGYVATGNALFGLVAGYLFWRYGLESAVIAHVMAHALAFVVRG